MHSTTRSLAAMLAVALGAGGAQAAGTVQVIYVQPERFADVGHSQRDIDDNLQRLTRHFEALAARHLGDGQKLNVEVLDVDLAGEARPMRRSGEDLRIVKGTVDWPRIKLRYTLESAGQAPRTGERQLQDMAYLQRIGSNVGVGSLLHEYRLLDSWFAAEFPRTAQH